MELFCMPGPRLTPTQEQARDSLNAHMRLEYVPCLCGKNEFEQLADRDRYGIHQPVVICKACGLIQSSPRMSAADYVSFYSSDAYRMLYDGESYERDWDATYTSARGAPIRAALKHLSYRSVVEIGAGGGWNLVAFDGCRVVGFDYSEHLTQLGRGHGIDMRRGSIPEAIASGERFDVIVLSHVLEHFLDPVAELRSLHALLTPGGVLYVGVPATDYPWRQLLQNAHTYYFTDRTLRAYLGKAGWVCGDIAHENRFRMHTLARPGEAVIPLDTEYRDSLARLKMNRWKLPLILGADQARSVAAKVLG